MLNVLFLLVQKLRISAIEFEFYEGKYARKWGKNDDRARAYFHSIFH